MGRIIDRRTFIASAAAATGALALPARLPAQVQTGGEKAAR